MATTNILTRTKSRKQPILSSDTTWPLKTEIFTYSKKMDQIYTVSPGSAEMLVRWGWKWKHCSK